MLAVIVQSEKDVILNIENINRMEKFFENNEQASARLQGLCFNDGEYWTV